MSTQKLQLPPLAEAFIMEVAQKHHPKANVAKKSESKLMKAINFIIKRFNPEFMNYITTIGYTIYVPDDFVQKNDDTQVVEILAHETQHIIDYVASPAKFTLGYLFPQVLALLSLLALGAFFNTWMLLWLIALVFLAPIPSPGRYKAEINGYRVSILFARHRVVFDGYRLTRVGYSDTEMAQLHKWISNEMTTANYYFAWPFPKQIEEDLTDEGFMIEPRYQEIIKFLQNHNRLPI